MRNNTFPIGLALAAFCIVLFWKILSAAGAIHYIENGITPQEISMNLHMNSIIEGQSLKSSKCSIKTMYNLDYDAKVVNSPSHFIRKLHMLGFSVQSGGFHQNWYYKPWSREYNGKNYRHVFRHQVNCEIVIILIPEPVKGYNPHDYETTNSTNTSSDNMTSPSVFPFPYLNPFHRDPSELWNKYLTDPQKDRFIFVSYQLSTLNRVFNLPFVKMLKLKYGIYLASTTDDDNDAGNDTKLQILFDKSGNKCSVQSQPLHGSQIKSINQDPDQQNQHQQEITITLKDMSITQNLCGNHFAAIMFRLNPYVVIQDGIPVGGLFHNLLYHASHAYNYTYVAEDKPFKGVIQLPNRTWIGQIAEIIYGPQDFVLGSIQTVQRNSYVDFAQSVGFLYINFMTSHPKKFIEWAAIIYPFTLVVWLNQLAAFVAICILFIGQIMLRVDPPKTDQRLTLTSTKSLKTWVAVTAQSLEIAYGILMEQSVSIPRKIRSMGLLWIFGTFTLRNYFRSDFIAYVTFPTYEYVPRTYQELAANKEYSIQLINLSAASSRFFNNTKVPAFVAIRKRYKLEPNALKCITAVIEQHKTACIGYNLFSMTHIANDLSIRGGQGYSPVLFSRDAATRLFLNMGFPRGSKFWDSFDKISSILRDTGNIKKWIDDSVVLGQIYGADKVKKSPIFKTLEEQFYEQHSSDTTPFNLMNVLVSFIVLIGGLVLAIILFTVEVLPIVGGQWKSLSVIWENFGKKTKLKSAAAESGSDLNGCSLPNIVVASPTNPKFVMVHSIKEEERLQIPTIFNFSKRDSIYSLGGTSTLEFGGRNHSAASRYTLTSIA